MSKLNYIERDSYLFMKSVAIVLSTYNGEKYISEQLNSLGKQTYPNVSVFIHDDGSEDRTRALIESFVRNYTGKIKFCIVDNAKSLKYPACFIDTLQYIGDVYDYYAFCDQDDVWNENKIENGVMALEKEDNKMPLLYYTAVDYYDANLNFIRHSRFASHVKDSQKLGFQDFLLGGEPLGMTFVFNKKVRNIVVELYEMGYKSFKDGFIKILCASTGKIIYDVQPSAKYRRHSEATTGAENPSNIMLRYYREVKRLVTNQESLDEWRCVLRVIADNYGASIHENDRELFDLFESRITFRTQCKKVLWKKRFRNRVIDELGYRLLFLTGKL